MVLSLYKLDPSPPVRATLMTIEALQIPDVEYIDVNILEGEHFTEEYTKMNPMRSIPTLKDDDFVIWDSHAIGVYLITKYGKNDHLYPADPQKRAVVNQRLHFDSGTLFPATQITLRPIIFMGETTFRPENIEKVTTAYEIAEKLLTADWIAGDDVTLADICCGATISSMNEILPIDSSTYPNLAAWLKRFSQLEFFKKANAPGLEQFRGLLKSKLA